MEVANVVASIIDALGNGKDLFRRMIGRKSKRKGRKPTMSEEEAWLQESLSRRPREVQATFDDSVARHGRRFTAGDSTAHSSLAHTLLVLNSGLVNLINSVLHRDSKYDPKSSHTLFHLSENATRDTLNALSQLSLRLASLSSLELPEARRKKKHHRQHPELGKRRSDTTEKTVPIIRGAWVRPKHRSSSSVVSSQTTLVPRRRPDEAKRAEVDHDHNQRTTRRPSPSKDAPTTGSGPKQQAPGMLVVSSDMFLPAHDTREESPGQPHQRHRSHPPRPRPASAATFMTTSTKIGEILPRATYPSQPGYDANMVEYITDHAEVKPKKLRRGFRFWKQDPEVAPVLAH